jgi:hypothetical protein
LRFAGRHSAPKEKTSLEEFDRSVIFGARFRVRQVNMMTTTDAAVLGPVDNREITGIEL